jgi:hypothetical protein
LQTHSGDYFRRSEGYLDGEIDEGNDEPSLGSLTSHGEGDQSRRAAGGVADVEEEHDVREPVDNEGGDGAAENDEPTLGWPERVNQAANAGSRNGGDRELQNHLSVRPRKRRGKKGITVEGRGYGDRKIIRGLTDHQSAALDERMDRYGTVSLETINTRGLL